MPANFSSIPGNNLKKLKLTGFLLLSPLLFYAQSLTGLWIGVLSNDSTTVRKDQSFEIALTEYKGKVYGYSRSEFIVDDVLYFVVKRVKGTIEGDICEVQDDEIIAYNFLGKLDKGIKVTSIFRRGESDSAWYLDGTWKTNQTKKYYSVTGRVSLEEEKDLTASKIFPHLEELKLANEVAFYKDRKDGPPIVKLAKPETNRFTNSTKPIDNPTTDKTIAVAKPNLPATSSNTSVEEEKQPDAIVANSVVKDETKTPVITADSKTQLPGNVSLQPATVLTNYSTDKQPDGIATNTVVKEETKTPVISSEIKTRLPNGVSSQPAVTAAINNKKTDDKIATNNNESSLVNNKEVPATNKPVAKVEYADNSYIDPNTGDIVRPKTKTTVPATKNNTPVNNEFAKSSPSINLTDNKTNPLHPQSEKTVTIDPVSLPAIPVVRTTVAERSGAAGSINDRKTEVSQVVNFRSDSLQIALYDNGQIDGDTVSVLMNGEIILAKQGLKASAIRKTIYIDNKDEFTLVLYAENLGSYPPNTGLLIVRDGDDVYNLRFSSDFSKNAGIVFRRKK